ncbi:hypothetical protein CMK11_03350 [Candidatus Poribacteria bacterium]|nr:hypothetical protein [Candidatus Poribacteria bacterium]
MPTGRDTEARIVAKREVAPNHFEMRLACDAPATEVEPGQFLHLWLPERVDPLLRRPYTVYRTHDDGFDILFQVVGRGSGLLAQCDVGATVRVAWPLGGGFALPPDGSTAIVVGGGVGMASLYLLIERLARAHVPTQVLLGARSRDYVLCRSEIEALGVPLHIATDDGSEGHHGFVTELAATVLDETETNTPHVYACGPTPMMQALTKVATERDAPTQVALENRMGCGLGVCLGCVVPIRADEDVSYKRVCVEGPVFDARVVIWEYRV